MIDGDQNRAGVVVMELFGLFGLILISAVVCKILFDKRCPECRLAVPRAARICPHCRSRFSVPTVSPQIPAIETEGVESYKDFEREKRKNLKRLAKISRQMDREDAYRAIGIEPGPFAWFRARSDLQQALLMGVAIALPTAIVAITVFRLVAR